MLKLLDNKFDDLKSNPSTNFRDCKELGNGYPIEWNEMLGRIFHRICYKYNNKILNTLPTLIFKGYK